MNQMNLILVLGFLVNGIVCWPFEIKRNVLKDIQMSLNSDLKEAMKKMDHKTIDEWKKTLASMNEKDAKNLFKQYLKEAMSEPEKRNFIDNLASKINDKEGQSEEDMENYLNELMTKREEKSVNFDSIVDKLDDLEDSEEILKVNEKMVPFNPDERDFKDEALDTRSAEEDLPFNPDERDETDQAKNKSPNFDSIIDKLSDIDDNEEILKVNEKMVPFNPDERDFKDTRSAEEDLVVTYERDVNDHQKKFEHLELIEVKGEPLLKQLKQSESQPNEGKGEPLSVQEENSAGVSIEKKGYPLSAVEKRNKGWSESVLDEFLKWKEDKRSSVEKKMDEEKVLSYLDKSFGPMAYKDVIKNVQSNESIIVSKQFLTKLIEEYVRLKNFGTDK